MLGLVFEEPRVAESTEIYRANRIIEKYHRKGNETSYEKEHSGKLKRDNYMIDDMGVFHISLL